MMKYLIIDYSAYYEIRLAIQDDETKALSYRNYLLVNGYNKEEDVLRDALEMAIQYGVNGVWIYRGVGNNGAYDYIGRNSHTADPWFGNIKEYSVEKLR